AISSIFLWIVPDIVLLYFDFALVASLSKHAIVGLKNAYKRLLGTTTSEASKANAAEMRCRLRDSTMRTSAPMTGNAAIGDHRHASNRRTAAAPMLFW